jgi:hypothetical protein
VRELDLAPPLRRASARPPDAAAADVLGVHLDVELASATL